MSLFKKVAECMPASIGALLLREETPCRR